MNKEKHPVTNGFLHSTHGTTTTYNLDCIMTKQELYYKLTIRYAKLTKEINFGNIEEAMQYISLLSMTYANTFRTWEILNMRLSE